MLPTRSLRVAAIALAFAATACSGPTVPKATAFSQLASYELYALTGAPARASTSVSFTAGALHADANFAFDLAFDLDGTGKVVASPVRNVAGALAGVQKRVGMQVVSGTFESVRDVPSTGYDTLGAKTLTPGSVVAVELQEFAICQYSLGGFNLYSKFVVDSVLPATRRIFLRAVIDPNCGYRQVVADSVPEF